MKKLLAVLGFLLPLSAMSDGGDSGGSSGGDGGSTTAEKVTMHRRAVTATYYPKGGYTISEADAKPNPALNKEKKKPTSKPVAKK